MPASAFDFDTFAAQGRSWVDAELGARMPGPWPDAIGEADPGRLIEAMRYAVLSGGKRMRPIVCLAACLAAGGRREQAAAAACAVELVHAYSLVHDDLPAMDDDVERRGRPTVHVAFGEASAILVGDALLTHAHALLVQAEEIDAATKVQCLDRLTRHAGVWGMVGGQARDLALGQAIGRLDLLEEVHAQKTGGLYAAAAAMGALCAGADAQTVKALEGFGLDFGIAFQDADDVLDAEQAPLREAAAARLVELAAGCHRVADAFDQGRAAALHAIAAWVLERGRGESGESSELG